MTLLLTTSAVVFCYPSMSVFRSYTNPGFSICLHLYPCSFSPKKFFKHQIHVISVWFVVRLFVAWFDKRIPRVSGRPSIPLSIIKLGYSIAFPPPLQGGADLALKRRIPRRLSDPFLLNFLLPSPRIQPPTARSNKSESMNRLPSDPILGLLLLSSRHTGVFLLSFLDFSGSHLPLRSSRLFVGRAFFTS